jgi:Na+/glutamate symporter
MGMFKMITVSIVELLSIGLAITLLLAVACVILVLGVLFGSKLTDWLDNRRNRRIVEQMRKDLDDLDK